MSRVARSARRASRARIFWLGLLAWPLGTGCADILGLSFRNDFTLRGAGGSMPSNAGGDGGNMPANGTGGHGGSSGADTGGTSGGGTSGGGVLNAGDGGDANGGDANGGDGGAAGGDTTNGGGGNNGGGNGGDGGDPSTAGTTSSATDAGVDGGDVAPPGPPDVAIDSVDVVGLTVSVSVLATERDHPLGEVEIDWGDGTTDTAAPGAGGDADFSHVFRRAEGFTLTVTATDDEGLTSDEVTRDVTTTLPTDELILHMKFDANLNAEIGTALQTEKTVDYATDRHGFGERAADMQKDGSSDEFPLLYGNNLGIAESFSFAIWSYFLLGNETRLLGQGDWFTLYNFGNGVGFGGVDGLFEDSGPHVEDGIDVVPAWHFYVGVVDSALGELRLYRDGVLAGSVAAPGPHPNPGTCRFYVGDFGTGDLCTNTEADEFSGLPAYVDDLRVYDRVLSAEEIEALYYEGE